MCLDIGKYSMVSISRDLQGGMSPKGKSGSCPGDPTLALWSPTPSRSGLGSLDPRISCLKDPNATCRAERPSSLGPFSSEGGPWHSLPVGLLESQEGALYGMWMVSENLHTCEQDPLECGADLGVDKEGGNRSHRNIQELGIQT